MSNQKTSFAPLFISLAVFLCFTTYQCSVNSECKRTKCPAGQEAEAYPTAMSFGFDYACVCGADL
jgi:hypothetical protein